ncbi:hypothetical protein [Staphylococcus phage PT1-9]
MKFLAGFITATLIALILVISAWLYFDLPIDTNDETQETTPPQEAQQQSYNDHIEQQTNERLPYSIDESEAIRLSKVQPDQLSGQDKQTQQEVLSTAYDNVKNGNGSDFDKQLINNIEQTHEWEDK